MAGRGRYTRYNGPGLNYPRSLKNCEIHGFAVSWELLLPHMIHRVELALPGGPPNPLM